MLARTRDELHQVVPRCRRRIRQRSSRKDFLRDRDQSWRRLIYRR